MSDARAKVSVLLFSDDGVVAIPFTHNKTTFTEYLRFPHHTTRIINGIEFDDVVRGTGNIVFKPDQGYYDGVYVRVRPWPPSDARTSHH